MSATQLESEPATGLLDARVPGTYATRLASQRRLMLVLADEIAAVEVELPPGPNRPGYRRLLTVKGIDPVPATFVAEIGDVTRFPTAGALCCWAGLTPRHYESDKTVHRGHISKEGDPLVRWAAVEAVQRQCEPTVKAVKDGIVARRGKGARRLGRPGPLPRTDTSRSTRRTAGSARRPAVAHHADDPAAAAARSPASPPPTSDPP